jgi:peptide/nickel transport system permease protein
LAPGDPALAQAGEWANWAEIDRVRARWGLDKPIHEQLIIYLKGVIRGDLGYSYHYNQPVLDVIMGKMPATLLLVFTSMILGMVLGTLIGTFCASKYGSVYDDLISTIFVGFYSMPVFWVGIILVITLALRAGWFPFAGFIGFGERTGLQYVADVLWHMVLPCVTLMISLYIPVFVRISRSSVVEVMSDDYIITVRAAGLNERTVFFRHALRNAMVPVIQVAGQWLSQALMGVVMTETVFSWPGIGTLMWGSLISRDYPVLQGIFLISGIWVVIVLLVIDLISASIDPRITYK